MQSNPNVALLFYWDTMLRQVRIEGRSSLILDDPKLTEELFYEQPREIQILYHMNLVGNKTKQQLEAMKAVPKPKGFVVFEIDPKRIEFFDQTEGPVYNKLNDRWIVQ